MKMDMVLFFWLPRAILAFAARRNVLRWYVLYSKVRWVTSIVTFVLLFILLLVLVSYNAVRANWTKKHYSLSLVFFFVGSLVFLVDWHFCMVIQYRTKRILRIAQRE